jgi:hypothetical protein
VGFGSLDAFLDAFGEVDLLSLGKKGSLADLIQIHLDGVSGIAAAQIPFENLFDELLVFFFVVEGVVKEICVDDRNAVLTEEAVDLLDLIGREVHLLEEVEDLAGFQGAGLLANLEEFLDLLYVPKVALGLHLLLCVRP